MEEDDKGCPMIRIGVSGWVFLLVPAYPGCPGPKAVKLCVCVCVVLLQWLQTILFLFYRNSSFIFYQLTYLKFIRRVVIGVLILASESGVKLTAPSVRSPCVGYGKWHQVTGWSQCFVFSFTAHGLLRGRAVSNLLKSLCCSTLLEELLHYTHLVASFPGQPG